MNDFEVTADNMDISYVPDEIKKQLEKIDFNARRWVKSKILCNKLMGVTRQDALQPSLM